jgi:ABC-type lipoprotein export system ATPase subunit
LGFSFQEPVLLPGLTALDNVLLPCIPRAKSMEFSNFKERAIMLLEALGLRDRVGFKPHQLSTGQKKRVDLARALINNPKVLITDEPTTNLDEESAQIIAEMLKKRLEEGFTILLATHQDQTLLSMAKVKLKLLKYKS